MVPTIRLGDGPYPIPKKLWAPPYYYMGQPNLKNYGMGRFFYGLRYCPTTIERGG